MKFNLSLSLLRDIGERDAEEDIRRFLSFLFMKLEDLGNQLGTVVCSNMPNFMRKCGAELLRRMEPVYETREELQRRINQPSSQIFYRFINSLNSSRPS